MKRFSDPLGVLVWKFSDGTELTQLYHPSQPNPPAPSINPNTSVQETPTLVCSQQHGGFSEDVTDLLAKPTAVIMR